MPALEKRDAGLGRKDTDREERKRQISAGDEGNEGY